MVVAGVPAGAVLRLEGIIAPADDLSRRRFGGQPLNGLDSG